MLTFAVYTMIFLGTALMAVNVIAFIRFTAFVREKKLWRGGVGTLYIPIALLVLFLAGYLLVAFFGSPDLFVAAILFGGSVFVYVMYCLLNRIILRVVEAERVEARLLAAEESDRAKSAFLATMSHEMRTPMNVILGLDAAALKNPDLSPETREQLEKMGHSGRRLLELINNVLDINEAESGSLKLRSEPFSLGGALGEVNAISGTLAGDKGLGYSQTAAPGVPDRLTGDQTRLVNVLLQLTENAVKYTDAPGSVTLSVSAGEGDDLVFRVEDNGIGIDPEFLPRVFDAFTQEDGGFTTKYSGSGLGLAAVKKTVELMGGRIEVGSEKGVGSVFTVTLPLPAAGPEPEETGSAEDVSLDGRRVLIAEDVPENAEIVMDLMELEGIGTDHAVNGEEAVELFSRSAPGEYDAVLMDLRMPVMDGYEATRRIRALERPDAAEVPIIALTANAFESDIKKSFEAGMNAHLAKPADAEALYSALRESIGARERSRKC